MRVSALSLSFLLLLLLLLLLTSPLSFLPSFPQPIPPLPNRPPADPLASACLQLPPRSSLRNADPASTGTRETPPDLSSSPSCRAELISRYLNGPRQLSSSHLSHLTLSTPPSSSAASSSAGGGEEGPTTFDLLLTTTHFVADGLALHQLANELYLLLGDRSLDLATLEGLVQAELADHRGRLTTPTPTPAPAGVADESGSEPCWLPLAAEDRLLRSLSRPSSASASTSAAATAAAAAAASGRAKVRRAIGKLVLRRAQAKGVVRSSLPPLLALLPPRHLVGGAAFRRRLLNHPFPRLSHHPFPCPPPPPPPPLPP